MKHGMEQLSIPVLDKFEAKRESAYARLNDAERALQMYGDVVDLTGESITGRYNREHRLVAELTRVGILAGYLNKDLET